MKEAVLGTVFMFILLAFSWFSSLTWRYNLVCILLCCSVLCNLCFLSPLSMKWYESLLLLIVNSFLWPFLSLHASTNVSCVVSRRDMATQMSPVGSNHSSPTRKPPFPTSTPSALPIVELQSVLYYGCIHAQLVFVSHFSYHILASHCLSCVDGQVWHSMNELIF